MPAELVRAGISFQYQVFRRDFTRMADAPPTITERSEGKFRRRKAGTTQFCIPPPFYDLWCRNDAFISRNVLLNPTQSGFALVRLFTIFAGMKRLVILFATLAALQTYAQRIEATLPSPDAKAIGMGGVMMTTLSGSHAIYNNSAMAVFSSMPSQISSSYYGQKNVDYYAVSGYCRFDNVNLAQIGWRQYLREHGNNDMAVDLGYSRRMGDKWSLGVVARYMHLKRPEISADALAVDLSAAYQLPLENVGSFSTLRAGAKLGNLGGYIDDTDYTLPMDFTVGAALDTFLTDAHEITVGADAGYYFTPSAVRGFQLSVGAEYNLMQLVQLRTGYHYGERRDYYPSYWTVGAGVRILHLRLDFAYLFAKKDTPLRNTYSISFGLDF